MIESGGDTVGARPVTLWNCNDRRMKKEYTIYEKVHRLSPALAANAELTAMSHGGTAQTGYVKKTKTGDPSVTINSLTGLQDTLLLNFRIRYSNGTAATSNYTFSGTGPRTVYYLNADGFNAVDSSFFARVQTQSAQTTSVTINFSWAP